MLKSLAEIIREVEAAMAELSTDKALEPSPEDNNFRVPLDSDTLTQPPTDEDNRA